jgi:glyoxylase-like metal-dependent hydrolase (beta-lactamase superfamily II)
MVVGDPEPVGEGAWALRGSLPRHGINVCFVLEENGVACFDTGSREMGGELKRLAAPHGGISRTILSHAHYDHRGGARAIGAPVLCHPAERDDVQGAGGKQYPTGSPWKKVVKTQIMGALRDSGPLQVAGTVSEGDPVGSFIVLHLPGHTPGQIALWREQDRAILASDCFYTLDEQTAAYPYSLFGQDEEAAAASLRRIIELQPKVAWPGHGPALRGDVSGALERALVARARAR